MDLNAFIFRDDSIESLGSAGAEAPDEDFAAYEDTSGTIASAKLGLAAIGAAGVGLSSFLGQITKTL